MGDGFVMSGNIKYIIRVVTGRSRNVKEKRAAMAALYKIRRCYLFITLHKILNVSFFRGSVFIHYGGLVIRIQCI